MGKTEAQKIHSGAEVDRLKKELVEDEKKAQDNFQAAMKKAEQETDKDKKKALIDKAEADKKKADDSNADSRAFLDGITEAEKMVDSANAGLTAARGAITSIETQERQAIKEQEKQLATLKSRGDTAGAAAVQRSIDLEETKMVGKRKAREALDS